MARCEDAKMTVEVEQRLQGLLQLHRGLQHQEMARQLHQRGHSQQKPLARSPESKHQKVSSPATNKFSCSTSTRHRMVV